MDYKTVIIELSNGQTRHIPMYEFDYYAHSNELEHKTEHIIICIDNLSRSFLYETDERGEIENKELITKVSFSNKMQFQNIKANCIPSSIHCYIPQHHNEMDGRTP